MHQISLLFTQNSSRSHLLHRAACSTFCCLYVWLYLTWGVPDRDSYQHLLSPARMNPQHLRVSISGLGSFWVFYREPASFRMNVSSTCPKAYARRPLLKGSCCCCFCVCLFVFFFNNFPLTLFHFIFLCMHEGMYILVHVTSEKLSLILIRHGNGLH